eukprot:augustus_masked-scaffold_2-processed-gene-11.41-mRNA-1 protein AED:0.42 eAED:0.42 QI:0/-1/0/1/-1/1/1/0/433
MSPKVISWTIDKNFTKTILKDKFDIYTKARNSPVKDIFKSGIVSTQHGSLSPDKGRGWNYQRKTGIKLFTRSSFNGQIADVISAKCENLVAKIEAEHEKNPKESFVLKPELYHLAFCVIGAVGFGLDFEQLEEGEEYQRCFDSILKLGFTRLFTIGYWLPFGLGKLIPGVEKNFTETLKKMDDFCKKIAKSKNKLSIAEQQKQNDLLSFFLVNKSAMQPKDTKVSDIILNFMFAGRDTSSIVMSFAVYFLVVNPDVQEKVYQEIKEKLGEKKPTLEDFKKLKYLDAVVFETMRLNPPVQSDGKHVQRDDYYNSAVLFEKGTCCSFDIFSMGRNPRVYENPEQFYPERWVDENREIQTFDEYEFPVFQGGPRICLGKDLALLEIKSFVVSLFRKFRVRFDESELSGTKPHEPLYGSTMVGSYKNNLKILVEPRV